MKAEEAVVTRLLDLCEKYNISYHRLAYVSAMPPSTVKNILYGKSKNTGIVTIARICDGLSISVYDFFNNNIFDSLEQDD